MIVGDYLPSREFFPDIRRGRETARRCARALRSPSELLQASTKIFRAPCRTSLRASRRGFGQLSIAVLTSTARKTLAKKPGANSSAKSRNPGSSSHSIAPSFAMCSVMLDDDAALELTVELVTRSAHQVPINQAAGLARQRRHGPARGGHKSTAAVMSAAPRRFWLCCEGRSGS